MENNLTIVEAIKEVLKKESPLPYENIYKRIVADRLYDFGAKDPKSIVGGMIRRHCYGKDFPSSSPSKHFYIAETKGRKAFYAIYNNDTKVPASPSENIITNDALPEEIISVTHKKHMDLLKKELFQAISEADWKFLEKLVVKLLLKMGYGWSEDSGIVTGGAFDDGIDGIIFEDKLELSKIYIQAKKFSVKNAVKGKDIREFVGAMALKGAQRGVFITTSTFSKQAIDHLNELRHINISLIDGHYLSELLILHNLGVKTIKTFTTFAVEKEDFFDLS